MQHYFLPIRKQVCDPFLRLYQYTGREVKQCVLLTLFCVNRLVHVCH